MVSEAGARRLRVGAWIVATALIALLLHSVDRARLLRVVTAANGWWLAAAVLGNLCIQPLGAMQWWSLLPAGASITRRRMLRLFSLTSVANNTTPSLVGHATGTLLLAAEPGVGKSAALSVLALDQLAVGLVKVSLLLGVSAVVALPTWMRRGVAGLGMIVGALLVGSVVVAARTRYLDVLRRPAKFATGLGFAIAVKAAEASAICAVQAAFGMTPSVGSVLVVLAATALSSVVPIAPANLGTYEAAAYGAYRFLGLPSESALGIAVVQHACQLLPAVGAGYLLLSVPRVASRTPPLRV